MELAALVVLSLHDGSVRNSVSALSSTEFSTDTSQSCVCTYIMYYGR